MAGIGHFFAWDGGCILIGHHTDAVPPHSHQAIQLVFGVDAPIKVSGGDQDDWKEYPAAIIPSRQPHTLDATTASYAAVILIEPETREGRALTEMYLADGVASVDDGSLSTLIPTLFDTWLEQPSAAAVSRAVWSIIQTLTRGVQPSVITDPRIERAVAYINAHIADSLTLDAVAREAYLSPSRFRHLFVEQTGMGLRPYILWRRFLKVWELLMAGESLSMAAHVAGFADSAHLTRTSRRMFGLAPSTIQILSGMPARERVAQD
jgi:AraC family transcriptional regulator